MIYTKCKNDERLMNYRFLFFLSNKVFFKSFLKITRVAIIILIFGLLLEKSLFADISLNADMSARMGILDRSGDWVPAYRNTKGSIDGNFSVFLKANKDLKNGYSASFNCVTAAATANGAYAAFVPSALPTTNRWSAYFAGQENFPNNQGGFASYAATVGDNVMGAFCNDEVYGTIATPYGRLHVGVIMNPLRMLYDMTTVDPIWGNQRGYYQNSDIRGNSLQYANNWGPMTFKFQLSTSSDASDSKLKQGGRVYTGLLAYDFGNGRLLGGGAMYANAHFPGNKLAQAYATKEIHSAFGLTGKTPWGPVNLAFTFMSGTNDPENFSLVGVNGTKHEEKFTDTTIKATYNISSWSLEMYGTYEKTAIDSPWSWNGGFTVQDGSIYNGQRFDKLDTRMVNLDFWAMYHLWTDATPFLRLNTISKKFTAEDLGGWQSKIRSTKFETGFLLHF
ncbi:MAG: hypothetical protein HQK53_08940 [Oligoflexia bacterium]|nr:hypothetical protein [Oligoflexia bacterium]